MPEEQEIETEKLHEAIHEEMEKEGGAFLRSIALTTGVLAAVGAIAALMAGSTANEALVLKTEATQLQAQASDQWEYYQAKGLKMAIAQATAAPWQAAGKPVPSDLAEKVTKYQQEQDSIKQNAEGKEKERDQRSLEADHLMHAHHHYANAVALLQVAIALGALAALTRARALWFSSMAVGAAGVVLFGMQLLG
ncbi:MAG TPA: DUF4337 family protein [Gemmatimonadales bacterium]|nr:DUF4337 family protein [Gemmatimonadales bacterium]